MLTNDEIFEKVQTALVDALSVDEEEVTRQSTLVGDLGAESIDFLDIQFRIQKAFNIKSDELVPMDVFTNPDFVQDGRVTDAGMAELRRRMPYTSLDRFSSNPTVQDVRNAMTVDDLCKFVESKVAVAQ